MAEVFGFDLAYVALFVTMIGVGASVVFGSWANKRATVKEVKEHTDLKIDALETKVEAKLETIEYKITVHEGLLQEIKQVNKNDLLLISKELADLRKEVSDMQKFGTTETKVRAEFIEKRLSIIEDKLNMLMERAFADASVNDKARKDALHGDLLSDAAERKLSEYLKPKDEDPT